MQAVPKDLALALTAIVGRLGQMYDLWHQALQTYFEPTAFLIALQNCITTSRTVTFILQNHKSAFPRFDEWYGVYQKRFGEDVVMQWAKNARNKIEKRGDLETLSQIRAELVTGYVSGPRTNWIPAQVIWSPIQLLKSIPPHLLDPHVVESGVLSIERRWIDVELPDREVLDALAHVYGQLALMIVNLHQHCGVAIPPVRPSLGQPLLRNLLPDGRVPSMQRPLEDRAVYLAVKDGSVLSYRREFRRSGQVDRRKAKKPHLGERGPSI